MIPSLVAIVLGVVAGMALLYRASANAVSEEDKKRIVRLEDRLASSEADRCSGDSRAVNAFCDLIKAAPALAAEVLRLRAERDALRGIVVRLAGDDGMYSDDYGMHCLCGFKRDHGDGCLRAEAQALLGGER